MGNWQRATGAAMVQLLIEIGQALGPKKAEFVYSQLSKEPTDAYGNRVDWTVIAARIAEQTTRETHDRARTC